MSGTSVPEPESGATPPGPGATVSEPGATASTRVPEATAPGPGVTGPGATVPAPEPAAAAPPPSATPPAPRKRDPWLFVAIALSVVVAILTLVLIFVLLRGDGDGSAVDCSGVGIPGDGDIVFANLSANQPTFLVSEADELCFARADVVLPAAGDGTVRITVDRAVVRTLDMDELNEISGGGPEAAIDLDPPIGVAGGRTLGIDLSDCDRCGGLVVHLQGVRVNTT